MKPRGKALIAGAVSVAFLAALPHFATAYIVSLFLLIFMYIVLSQSWNIISGYTGYVSFGHVAFFGVGAYTAGLLITKAGWNWIPASVAGGGMAVAVSVVVGYPCLRLKGPYFAIAMLGLSEIMRVAALYWESLTGGGFGLSLPPVLHINAIYYAMGVVALAVTLFTALVSRSRFGLRLVSIREDEMAAEVMGINTTAHKLLAFMSSAFFPGVVGGIYAWRQSYIDPEDVFNILITVQMIIMTMFGGRGTVMGPVIGAVALSLIREGVWASFPFMHQALFGALIIGVVLFMPRGILGLFELRRAPARTSL